MSLVVGGYKYIQKYKGYRENTKKSSYEITTAFKIYSGYFNEDLVLYEAHNDLYQVLKGTMDMSRLDEEGYPS